MGTQIWVLDPDVGLQPMMPMCPAAQSTARRFCSFFWCLGKHGFAGYYFFIWIQPLWAFGREINNFQLLRW